MCQFWSYLDGRKYVSSTKDLDNINLPFPEPFIGARRGLKGVKTIPPMLSKMTTAVSVLVSGGRK